jgi:hypothetical protein
MTLIVVRTALVIQSLPIDKYNKEGKIERYFTDKAIICPFPTKYLCILVPAPLFLYLVPYLHQFSVVELNCCRICTF